MAPTKAVILVDPVTEWREVVKAALDTDHHVITIQMANATPQFAKFLPTSDQLVDAGVSHTITMEQRDVFDTLRQIQLLSIQHNFQIVAVVPLSEVAVEISDVIAAGLHVPHNRLDLITSRRDKGLMKHAVVSKGLRVAKCSRVKSFDEMCAAMQNLEYPVVVKTPSGMSTSDVFICRNQEEAITAMKSILGKVSPDGRVTNEVLLEEYIYGTEFAVNLMAFKSNCDNRDGTRDRPRVLVTDMWKYNKSKSARYESAEICNPKDFPELVTYAIKVAESVGVEYGAAHVELKATLHANGTFTNPTLIEVGARLSGGRKSTMAQMAVEGWNPFTSLILSHSDCPCPIRSGSYLSPSKFVRHVFLAIETSGKITRFDFTDTMTTLHSVARLVKVGDVVKATTDILSCAGFVWLVGSKDEVDRDTKELMASFVLNTDAL